MVGYCTSACDDNYKIPIIEIVSNENTINKIIEIINTIKKGEKIKKEIIDWL